MLARIGATVWRVIFALRFIVADYPLSSLSVRVGQAHCPDYGHVKNEANFCLIILSLVPADQVFFIA
ncbi:hypothetical protein [Hymenobacter sp. GOD-10R]|uniref:hypothetical protein n=1 Tax=Hymenobacter sp. GOD-10R TaxID=3093922 RepID=UPI002D7775D1|nr:hypothetical protein [Hymenobacter sp. GOD-10R]WRQ31731.1 hypothetical protein SD425_28890 [Hymenobacter sp. GOD-10R]